jgi:hypothetical protein
MLLQPEERTDSTHALKLDFPAATRHYAAIAPPAGLMVEVYAVHVEVFADLLDLAFVPRCPLLEVVEQFHANRLLSQRARQSNHSFF